MIFKPLKISKRSLLIGFAGVLVAACGYQGVEVFFFEEYAKLMDDEKYKGDSSRNTEQVEAFEGLMADLRADDDDYSWNVDVFDEGDNEAANVGERNDDLHDRTNDQIEFHRAFARYHAPVIYQDMDNAWRDSEGGSSLSDAEIFGLKVGVRDFPTSLLLQDANRVDENPAYIEGLLDNPADLAAVVPTLYFDVKETRTHYFITYVFYYPHNGFDNAAYKVPGAFPSPQSFDHDQDIEFCLLAIRKDEDAPGAGALELVLTTRHGTAHLHHPDSGTQTALRRAFGNYLTEKERTDAAMGPIYQPHAIRHDTTGSASFLLDQDGNRMGIQLYSPRFGHALSQANPEVWKSGYGNGLILFPESESMTAAGFDFDSNIARKGVRPYQLISWNEFMETYRNNGDVFVGSNSFSAELSDGEIRQRAGSPDAVIKGEGEDEAKTVLPAAATGDTPHLMALPHQVLSFFDELLGDESPVNGEISDFYLFNSDIQYESLD